MQLKGSNPPAPKTRDWEPTIKSLLLALGIPLSGLKNASAGKQPNEISLESKDGKKVTVLIDNKIPRYEVLDFLREAIDKKMISSKSKIIVPLELVSSFGRVVAVSYDPKIGSAVIVNARGEQQAIPMSDETYDAFVKSLAQRGGVLSTGMSQPNPR